MMVAPSAQLVAGCATFMPDATNNAVPTPLEGRPSQDGVSPESAAPPAPAARLESPARDAGRRSPSQTRFPSEGDDLQQRMAIQARELKRVTESLQGEIRQRQQMEDSLRRMEREAGDFFASAPVGFHWMSLDGTILDANQTESRLLGCDREELIGRNMAQFLPDHTALESLLRRLEARETVRDCEVELRSKDGTAKYALIDANVFEEGGQIVHVRCFVRDITERKQAEARLRGANDELEMWVRQRTAELVRNNEALQAEIQQRRQIEEAILESEQHYRELFHEARLMQEKLRSLSNRILFAQEEERKRISRELHDEVGQALTAINVNMAMLKRETTGNRNVAARKIEETQALLEQTMANVHRFARELRPAMLDDLGLIPALRSYTKDFAERTGITVRLAADLSEEHLNGEQKTVLYRVAQESLNNIAKHARASEVEVALGRQDDKVRMAIKDNGQGFQVNARTGKETSRLGLLGMEERVRLVNGSFTLESSPGQGTRLLVAIPVQKV